MKIVQYLTTIAFVLTASTAIADCPGKPPKVKWNTHSGDQRVNAAYLQKLLPGKKVKFGGDGTEVYHKNGKYTYRASGGNYDAPSYKFYSDGTRCINYPNPRFDLYVVNDKRLILVNAEGGRLEGKVSR
jgi:hypothetical protein